MDDNEEILWALRTYLSQTRGCEVVGALSSVKGLTATVRDVKPNILVLDLDMPGMSPLKALKELTRSGTPTRTVIFSGHLRRELIDQAIDAGAWGYVAKNDGEVSLVAAIQAIMAGEIAWSPEVQSVIAQR
ncbi:MAG TPA: response regulator transcription factor [Phycisphaerales bacterium]|nr:response regulator transcription factor [Phycisphaerales bacterium]